MGHCQPARHNNRQLTAYEKVLLFSGLTIAGSCVELGELVSEGLTVSLIACEQIPCIFLLRIRK
jgi:hypothetical protein